MTSPVPGMTYPNPRTWAAGDQITTPRLRGDMTNLAALFASGRPLMVGTAETPASFSAGTNTLGFAITYANSWNVSVVNSAGTNTTYLIPWAGWWLVQANLAVSPIASNVQDKNGVGFTAVVNGAGAASTNGGFSPAGTGASGDYIGMFGAELYQFNPETSDTIAWYGHADTTVQLWSNMLMAEWICLPTSGLTDYTGPYGTVVSSPAAVAAFPSGPGTYITNTGGIAAGAVSMTVRDATGMVTGGTLGLDYVNGQLNTVTAEAVTITSVTGTTIGISATSYAHLQNAPVAVPVSAAFLNQQCRDVVNFLAYPPVLRAASSTTQSIPSQTFPSGTQITTLGTETVDNFGGFSSSTYTAPVGGIYYVYGQVYFAGTTASTAYAAGISVAGGTIQWGTQARSDTTSGAQAFCMTVVRHLRLTAGQTITLWAWQNSGSSMNTVSSGAELSKLIVVWRSV